MADAPPPLSAPLRVAVLGASASVETSYHGGPRSDLGYPRVVEAALRAAGVPATVEVHAHPGDRVRHGRAAWGREVVPWAPDVVVLHFGQADSVHLLLPRWLERHANSPRSRPGRVRDLYRKRLLRPAWVVLAKLQTPLDARLGPRGDTPRGDRRARRATAELAELLRVVRSDSAALVLVPTLVRPGPPWQRWFPGAAARMATLNHTFGEAVRQLGDPDVRTFPLADVVAAGVPADVEPTPDGGHFTPAVHRLVGEALADEILGWVASSDRRAGVVDVPVTTEAKPVPGYG